MEKFTETQEPPTRPSYTSSPTFVPGNLNQSHIGSLQDDGNLSAEINISLVINNKYQTVLDVIGSVNTCLDQSFWISSGVYKVLQRVKPEGTNLKVMSEFNIDVCGMAVTPSNQLLLTVKGKTRLQQISSTSELTDSVYDVSPLYPYSIHVTGGVSSIKATRQFLPIHDISNFLIVIGPLMSSTPTATHALTGCDTSFLIEIGKGRQLQWVGKTCMYQNLSF
ncbi:Hypothetical predicted protein [Mytilus galloprovincialis]|nr:Hypothetical predicted protein [Mytilus galloprovincialis]